MIQNKIYHGGLTMSSVRASTRVYVRMFFLYLMLGLKGRMNVKWGRAESHEDEWELVSVSISMMWWTIEADTLHYGFSHILGLRLGGTKGESPQLEYLQLLSHKTTLSQQFGDNVCDLQENMILHMDLINTYVAAALLTPSKSHADVFPMQNYCIGKPMP